MKASLLKEEFKTNKYVHSLKHSSEAKRALKESSDSTINSSNYHIFRRFL